MSVLSPESFRAVKEWMDFRVLHGEAITGD
jgi:hypothetical protein